MIEGLGPVLSSGSFLHTHVFFFLFFFTPRHRRQWRGRGEAMSARRRRAVGVQSTGRAQTEMSRQTFFFFGGKAKRANAIQACVTNDLSTYFFLNHKQGEGGRSTQEKKTDNRSRDLGGHLSLASCFLHPSLPLHPFVRCCVGQIGRLGAKLDFQVWLVVWGRDLDFFFLSPAGFLAYNGRINGEFQLGGFLFI